MTFSDPKIWLVIVVLGIGTYLIRFSFLGLIGNKALPEWVVRALRYTPVAVMPGLVAPLILWPAATGGDPDPARLTASAAAMAIGVLTRSVTGAVVGGMVTLYAMLYLLG